MMRKPLLRRSLAKKFQKEMRAKKVGLNDLLVDLKNERRQYAKKLLARLKKAEQNLKAGKGKTLKQIHKELKF